MKRVTSSSAKLDPIGSVGNVAPSLVEELPSDVILKHVYPRLDLSTLAAATTTCKQMQLRQPDAAANASQNTWTSAVRSATPAYRQLPERATFGNLRDAYLAEKSLQDNLQARQVEQYRDCRILGSHNMCTDSAVSSDGHHVAIPDTSGGVHILSTVSGFVRHLGHHMGFEINPVTALQWCDDDKFIAVAHRNGQVGLMNADTGVMQPFAQAEQDTIFPPVAAFSPTMRYIARCPSDENNSGLHILELDSEASTARLVQRHPWDYEFTMLKWSDSGNYLVACDGRIANGSSLWVIDVASGTVLSKHRNEQRLTAFAFTPDETSLVSAGIREQTLRILDLKTQTESTFPLVREHYHDLMKPRNSWTLINSQLAFEPYGKLMALKIGMESFHYGGVAIYDLETRACRFVQHPRLSDIAWAPGGRWLAMNSDDGLYLLDAHNHVLNPYHYYMFDRIQWSANGQHLFGFSSETRQDIGFLCLSVTSRLDEQATIATIDKDLQEAVRQTQLEPAPDLWNICNHEVVESALGHPDAVRLPNGATLEPQNDASGTLSHYRLRMPHGRTFIKETLESVPVAEG